MSDMSDEEPMDVEEDKLSTDKSEGDICGDGSILKEILVAGSGWEKPRSGAEVTVHYTGTLLSGEKFDSSVDRGDPFVFTIGKGQVIKGWDQGVATMLKGEKAKFTIVADKAYGSRGSPPKIPPNATLVFEVELISFTMFKDVSKGKDGSIMKKIIADSSEYKTPDDLSPVTLQITIKLEDGTVLKDTTGGEPWSFVIDDGSAFEELETAIKTMKQAEEAEFVIKTKNAFNPLSVPENATLNVVAKLVKFEKEDRWSMSNEDKLKRCDTVKELGNDLFKKGDYARAIRRYNSALEYLSSDHNFDDKEKSLAKDKKVSCRLNLAQCQLKQKAFKASLESCDEALKLDAVNVKALYRRGLANTEIGEWFAAEKDFKQVLEQDSKNTAAQQALRDLKKRQAEQDAKEKKLYKGMFDKLSKPAPAPAAAPAAAAPAAAAPAAAAAAAPEAAPMSE